MKRHFKILVMYQTFTSMILNQFNVSIKTFRVEDACEYLSTTMRSLLPSHGLSESWTPSTFLVEGVFTVVLVINVTTSSVILKATSHSCFLTLPALWSPMYLWLSLLCPLTKSWEWKSSYSTLCICLWLVILAVSLVSLVGLSATSGFAAFLLFFDSTFACLWVSNACLPWHGFH